MNSKFSGAREYSFILKLKLLVLSTHTLKDKIIKRALIKLICSFRIKIYRLRYLQSFLSSQLLYRTGYFWLGLSDKAKPGTYAWASGDSVSFTYWHNTHTGTFVGFFLLTHISLASFLWDIGKQHSPRCNAAERGIPSGAILFA